MSNDESGPEERPRGILTEADRQYLRNREEYSRQAAHARQGAIVERTRNGILDFSLLFDNLADEDWGDITGASPRNDVWFDDPDIEAGIRDTLASMVLVSGGRFLIRNPDAHDSTAERMLRDAFERTAWTRLYDLTHFEVVMETERIRWRELLDRLEDGDELSIDELSKLLIATRGDIDREALQAELREQLAEETGGE